MRHAGSGWSILNISLFQTIASHEEFSGRSYIGRLTSPCQAVTKLSTGQTLIQERRRRATTHSTPRWMFYVQWPIIEQSGCLSERLAQGMLTHLVKCIKRICYSQITGSKIKETKAKHKRMVTRLRSYSSVVLSKHLRSWQTRANEDLILGTY